MITPEKYVYIVEDEESLGVSLKIVLDASGFSIKVFASAILFKSFAKKCRPFWTVLAVCYLMFDCQTC
jgi:FixJ family two-component response regulator